MNALAQSADPAHAPPVPLLRTLVLCDLVDSTALVERLGDQRAAELFRKHDRLTRALLQTHRGREIDKTDGFLMMFDRPIQAVAFALDYQRSLKQLATNEKTALAARVGVHVGDVVTWDNSPDDIAKGAKLVEVEGLVKPITSRLMQLALPNQILLSGVAHALAHRAQGQLGEQLSTLRWRTHGRYRFKGIPDPIPVFEVGEEGHAPLKPPPWSGKAHREVPFWRRPATMGVEALLLLVLIVIPLWYLLKPSPAIAFANRDWVVVGDLKNLTGESSFDESVQTAFRIGLEQSRYVNVLSDLKTRETVKRMQRDPEKTAIDRAIGAEIAIRDGARALILPTIAEIGGRVRVTAEVIDPRTQTTVYSESADGSGENSVLPSLDKVNQQLRVRLGEALATVSNESQPLEKVATKNLDALRTYSLAEKSYATNRKDAIALYEQAIKLDPEFALARIGLARTLFTVNQDAAARDQVQRASTLRDRLSSRDALYVEAWQATFGPPTTALAKWKSFAALYPDFFPATGSYAYFARELANRYDEAIAAAQKAAVPQNPRRANSDYLLGMLYLAKERYSDALASFSIADQMGAAQRKEFYAAVFAAQRQFAKADSTLAAGMVSGVSTEDIDVNVSHVAFAADKGDFDSVHRLIEETQRQAATLGGRKPAQWRAIGLTLASAEARDDTAPKLRDIVHANATDLPHSQATDRPEMEFNALLAAYLAARSGDAATAKSGLDADLSAARSGGYPVLAQMLTVADAERTRAAGDPQRAITMLTSLVDGSELYVVHVALMDAHASAKNEREALAEAVWLTEHRGRAYGEANMGRTLTLFNVLQSDLALLRAAELSAKLGDKDQSQQRLRSFQEAWPAAQMPASIKARVQQLQGAGEGAPKPG